MDAELPQHGGWDFSLMDQLILRPVLKRKASLGLRNNPWLWISVACLSALSVASWMLGGVPLAAPWDVFILLDGAWRIFGGQVPNGDFHNAIGPLTYLLGAAGMSAAGPSLKAISIGNSLFLIGLLPFLIHLAISRRLTGYAFLVFALFIALLAAAPRPLGFQPDITSYAMLYNRYGWVLLCILTVQFALEPVDFTAKWMAIDAVVSGALLALLLLCKVNFFAGGVLLSVCVLFGRWSRWGWRRTILLCGGFTLVCLMFGLLRWVDVAGYLNDILYATTAQSRWDRADRFVTSLAANAVNFATVAAIAAVASLLARRASRRHVIEILAVSGVIASVGIMVAVGNTGERGELPLFFVAGLVAHKWSLPLLPRRSVQRIAYACFALATIGYLGATIVVGDVLAYIAAQKYRSSQTAVALHRQSFGTTTLQDFYVPLETQWRTAYWRSRDVPRAIRDGVELLRRHITTNSRVLTVALADPFSFALGLTPPRGVPLWWDLNLSFSARIYPHPVALFEDVNLVMIPILTEQDDGCCKQTVKSMIELYGPYLDRHFVSIAASEHWRLLRRVDKGT